MRADLALVATAVIIGGLAAAEAQATNGVGGNSSPQNLNQSYQPSPSAKPLQALPGTKPKLLSEAVQ